MSSFQGWVSLQKGSTVLCHRCNKTESHDAIDRTILVTCTFPGVQLVVLMSYPTVNLVENN